jgi:AmiR/NasT family two-component response regulator
MVHPDDSDGWELCAQLQRIGCQVEVLWPLPEHIPEDVDLVFLAVRSRTLSTDPSWPKRLSTPPVIAVVAQEDASTIEAVLRLDAAGVIASPVRPLGLQSTIALALHLGKRTREREKYVARVEQRLAAQRKIDRAKTILMGTRRISEDQAYKAIREQAMNRRITTEEIAEEVIKANQILGLETRTAKG